MIRLHVDPDHIVEVPTHTPEIMVTRTREHHTLLITTVAMRFATTVIHRTCDPDQPNHRERRVDDLVYDFVEN